MAKVSEYESDHGQICAEFLRRSREYLAVGQLLQASEKGWGAAAHAAILIAGIRDWNYGEHWEFSGEVIPQLARETGNNAVHRWGRSANELHRNFYRDNKDDRQISEYLEDVTNLVNLIRQLVGLPPV